MTTIVLADDHHIVRQALRHLLDQEPDLQVIGEAADGIEAVRLVEAETPDVLVLDLMMPGLNGMAVMRQLRQRSSATAIVILSMHAGEAYVIEALRNGALGYVLKDAHASDLVQAIRNTREGRRFLSAPLSERAIEAYIRQEQDASDETRGGLTLREQEILQLTAEGNTSARIGERLSISPRTVETHRRNLMRKLALHSHAELVRYAVQHGFIARP